MNGTPDPVVDHFYRFIPLIQGHHMSRTVDFEERQVTPLLTPTYAEATGVAENMLTARYINLALLFDFLRFELLTLEG